MTKITYRIKGLFGLQFQKDNILSYKESKSAHRHGSWDSKLRAHILNFRETELEMVLVFKPSKLSYGVILTSTRPHLPNLPQYHQLWTKYSNVWDYGGHLLFKESQSHWLLPCSLWSLSLCLISTMNTEDQVPLISALCTRMKESTTLKRMAALTCWQHWEVPRERKMRDLMFMVLFSYATPEALPGEMGITSWSFKRIFNFFFLWRIKQWRRELG